MDPVRSTGISAFDIGFNGRDLTERLWEEHRILVSGRDDELRVSIPYFALEGEVDKLVDVLAGLRQSGVTSRSDGTRRSGGTSPVRA